MRQLLPGLRFLSVLVLLFCVRFAAHAQLSGTYSINPLQPASATNYQSLTAALSDITAGTRSDGGISNGVGMGGAVVFELAADYTSTGETFPLVVPAITGASATNKLTIRPAAGVSSALDLTSNAADATLSVTGATYLHIDGRPGGVGSSKFLTIGNTNTASAAIHFSEGASRNTIRNATIIGVSTSASMGVVLFGTSASANGNNYNTIADCDIRDGATKPASGITSFGASGTVNSFNTISGCNVYNFISVSGAGIYSNANIESWTITGNSFYQTAAFTSGTIIHKCIALNGGSGHTISGNYMGGTAPQAGGSAWTQSGAVSYRFVAIDIAGSAGGINSIQNNTIANFNINTTNTTTSGFGVFGGISITSGHADIGTIAGNTIGKTGTGAFLITARTACAVNLISYSGTGNVNIANNEISSITTDATDLRRGGSSINCILLTGTGNVSVTNNIIGSTSEANSIYASAETTSSTQQITGISNAGSGSTLVTISGNTISGLTNNYDGSTSSSQVRGIVSSARNNIITGNTICHFSSASTSSSGGSNAAVIGISFTSTATGFAHQVSGNTIYGLVNTASNTPSVVIGLYVTGPADGGLTVAGNFVHSLSVVSSHGGNALNGINIGGGAGNTFRNNMVRLGIDTAGNSIASGIYIYGINYVSGTAHNFYHNSIYVGGTGVVSVQPTVAFNRLASSTISRVFNNIFVNARSNASGTAVNYAYLTGSAADYTTPYLVQDNNIFYAPGTGGAVAGAGGTAYVTLPEWQLISGLDKHSGMADPAFVNATGAAASVDLHLLATNPAEGMGNAMYSPSDDFDGQARAGFTPADIGADAGNFTLLDAFAPTIHYAAFPSTSSDAATRTLANVTITDAGTGVPVSGANQPRIWFRQSAPVASAWVSAAGTLSSGNGNNGNWDFVIDYSLLSITPTAGDVFEYYVVAQDQVTTPFVAATPGASHTDVNTQTTAPAVPNSYTQVVSSLGTSIYVGMNGGEDFPTLTGTGGLFEAINAAALTGNTTVYITSDLSEPGTNSLLGTGLAGYTLTIQPSAAATRTISNSADFSTSMIRLTGVNGVLIDGRFSGSGQYLRIINTNSTPSNTRGAIEIAGGSTNTTIRNCIIETNATTVLTGNVVVGTGSNTGITISNNLIRDAQGSPGTTGIPAILVYVASDGNVVSVQQNEVYNFTQYGIQLSPAGIGSTVTGNSIFYNAGTAPTTAITGIFLGWGDQTEVSGNYVGGQAASCGGSAWVYSANSVFTGIASSARGTDEVSIQGNTIQNISLTGTGIASFSGISIIGGKAEVGSISGNLIGHASLANSITNAGGTAAAGNAFTAGIDITSTSAVNVRNNRVANMHASGGASYFSGAVRGISKVGTGSSTIANNTIHNLSAVNILLNNTAEMASVLGIYIRNSGFSLNVAENTIFNIRNTSTTTSAGVVAGIGVNSPTGKGAISKNHIYSLSSQTTGLNTYIMGITMVSGAEWSIANNQISVSNAGYTNDALITGIVDNTTAPNKYIYNTVFVGGVAFSGAANSYGFLRSQNGALVLRNNLFYNERTGGTGNHYAIGNTFSTPATNWTATSSNYNAYVAPNASALAEWGSTTATSFGDLKTLSGGDFASYGATASDFNAEGLFTDAYAGNLRIMTDSPEAWLVSGKGIAGAESYNTAEDFSGNSRSVDLGTPTDIGAHEFNILSSVQSPLAIASAAPAPGTTTTYSFAGRKLGEITWGAGGTVPTTVNFQYYSGDLPPAFPTSTGWHSYYRINATGGSGFSYDVKLYYTDAEKRQVPEAEVKLYKQDGVTTNPWNKIGGTASSDASGKFVATSGQLLNSFSQFTGAPESAPLPVSILSFAGYRKETTNVLNWTTATETNNAGFEVQRSVNGTSYTTIGYVSSKAPGGLSTSVLHYTFSDAGATGNRYYYRLKQTDIDGKTRLSNIVLIRGEAQVGISLESLYPNPSREVVNLLINADERKSLMVHVTDMSGRVMATRNIHVEKGSNTTALDIHKLGRGTYLVRIFCNDGCSSKVVKLIVP